MSHCTYFYTHQNKTIYIQPYSYLCTHQSNRDNLKKYYDY